jgi:hypothetical protein
MAKEPGQEWKDTGQDNLLYKAWIRNRWDSLNKALGAPLAYLLAVLAGAIVAIIVLFALGLIVSLVWYLVSFFNTRTSAGLTITERKALVQGFASIAQAAAVGLTGLAGFIGLVFTLRILKVNRTSALGFRALLTQNGAGSVELTRTSEPPQVR